jgi:hypothetical protein
LAGDALLVAINTEQQMAFRKGVSGNPSGRPRLVGDLRDLARKFGPEGVKILANIARDADAAPRARVEAIKELFARGYGRIVSATDMMFLAAASERNVEGGEITIAVGFKSPEPLDEFASRAPEPAPLGTSRIEDMRPDVVASKRAALEEELRRNEAEIARLRAMQEQRVVDIKPDRSWPMDRPSDAGEWPGRKGRSSPFR